MISEAIRGQYLCDELQCPGALNQLVHSGDRAQFHLLLNMFCQDVTQQPQFSLGSLEPKELQVKSKTSNLRHQFELGEEPLLSADRNSSAYSKQLNELLAHAGEKAMHLSLSHRSEALSAHNNPKYIEPEVLAQLDPVSQLRHQERLPKPQEKLEPVSMYQVLSGFDYDKEIKVTHYS